MCKSMGILLRLYFGVKLQGSNGYWGNEHYVEDECFSLALWFIRDFLTVKSKYRTRIWHRSHLTECTVVRAPRKFTCKTLGTHVDNPQARSKILGKFCFADLGELSFVSFILGIQMANWINIVLKYWGRTSLWFDSSFLGKSRSWDVTH